MVKFENPFKHFKGIENVNFSLVTLIIFIISFFGILWLTLQNILAGQFYFSLIVGFMAIIFFSFMFIKEESVELGLKLPFSPNSKIAAIRYWFGFLIPVLFGAIIGFKNWIKVKLISPYLLFDISGPGAGQSFSALKASYSPFMQFFQTSWVAGSVEEIILGFEVVLIGVLIGTFLIEQFKSIKSNSTNRKLFIYGFAFTFSMIFFAIMHLFNPGVYTTLGAFLSAAVFRVLMNIAMFFFVGIEFTIGFHQSNNLIWLGLPVLLSGIFSLFGIIILIFWIVLSLVLFY
jgi:hypothetical protein